MKESTKFRAAVLAACLAFAPPATATSRGDYEDLVAGFAQETKSRRGKSGDVAALLPDVSPFHDKFLQAARAQEGDFGLPYWGWLLQNAPRNDKAHDAAVAAIDTLAQARVKEIEAGGTFNERAQMKATQAAIKKLKYEGVSDVAFARTLLDAKVLALAAKNAKTRRATEMSIFKLENLQVGMVAPDIVGKDLDGESFKLSDYRGKVVVLDFWGDW